MEETRPEETGEGAKPEEAPAPEEAAPAGEEAPAETVPTEAPPEAVAPEETSPAEAAKPRGIVGIRFEPCGKVYCFKSDGLHLKRGERVVVESDLGMSIGRVVIADHVPEGQGKDFKPVLRRVTKEDVKKEEDNNSFKQEAFAFCNERIMARGLDMKLLGTDVTLDRRRVVFFFSAETRIDFRELVKDLAAKFRTRIELRQVGVRDAARIAGGIGVCGRELCCRKFLTSFEPISIKMAKKQDLTLNTGKLSGVCGRLMCCLGYEYDERLLEERAREMAAAREAEAAREASAPPPPAPEPPREAAPAPRGAREGAPGPTGERGERHGGRRRRGRGRHGHEGGPREGGTPRQQPGPPQQAAPAQPQIPPQAAQGQRPEGAPHEADKGPFKRRRRRRHRDRGKKAE